MDTVSFLVGAGVGIIIIISLEIGFVYLLVYNAAGIARQKK